MHTLHATHELSVLIKNKPITEYFHENNHYIEGRKGSNYSLKLKNRTYHRVLYVISVDGLDVVEGKPAGLSSPGYVVEPYGEIVIEGWKVDAGTAAKFEFRAQEKSYSAEIGEDANNVGVIGVMVFNEKPKPYVPSQCYNLVTPFVGAVMSPTSSSTLCGSGGGGGGSGGGSGGARGTGGGARGFGGDNTMLRSSQCGSDSNFIAAQYASSVPEAPLGTGFGEATAFHTYTVEFEKVNPDRAEYVMVLYYDSRKGLEHRGIRIKKPRREPNPFPAQGCRVPRKWRKR